MTKRFVYIASARPATATGPATDFDMPRFGGKAVRATDPDFVSMVNRYRRHGYVVTFASQEVA